MVRLLGKMFCIFAELEFFRNGELFYGMLTLLLPFAPAVLSSLMNHESFKEFVMHLPFLQLRTHLDRIKWIMRLQNQISEFEEELEQDPGSTYLKERIAECLMKMDQVKTELQDFKIYTAMLESAPQSFLQLSILLKKLYSGEGWYFLDPIVILQICSSLLSVFMTIAGLLTEMPFLVGKTERPPFRSLGFKFGIILPLVTFTTAPRIFSAVTICSLITIEDGPFYCLFGLCYIETFALICIGIYRWMKSQNANFDPRLTILGLVTAFVSPCVIARFDSNFILVTNVCTTFLQSFALAVLCFFGESQPDYIFHFRSENEFEELWYLRLFTIILVPWLLFTNVAYFIIANLLTMKNAFYFIIHAIENDDGNLFRNEMECRNPDFSTYVPGDLDSQSLYWYTMSNSDTCAAIMVEQNHDLDLQQVNNLGMNALMLSCELSHPRTVDALLQKALEGVDVGATKLNKTYQYNSNLECKSSPLHYAALSEGPILDRKKVMESLWACAPELEIDVFIKNHDGKSVMDILEERAEPWMDELLEKYGSPTTELNKLKDSMTLENHEELLKDCKFVKNLEMLLIYAIEKDEKFAEFLIEEHDAFGLDLNYRTHGMQTPIMIACEFKKVDIFKALLSKANSTKLTDIDINGRTAFHHACFNGFSEGIQLFLEQSCDIDLNAKDKNGQTGLIIACEMGHSSTAKLLINDKTIDVNAKDKGSKTVFISACENGLVDVVALMLEIAFERGIDPNASDGFHNTGFICACYNERFEVANLLKSKAHAYGIDIHKKNIFGQSGLDFWSDLVKWKGFDRP